MEWEIEFTDEFAAWWDSLTVDEQESVHYTIGLLRQRGPRLDRPHAGTLKRSKIANLKELRIQHRGQPYRVLYCFDPRRVALLLIGGNKTGKGRWYKEFIPLAEKIYAEFLKELAREKRRKNNENP